MNSTTVAILAIAAVAVLALLLRRMAGGDAQAPRPAADEPDTSEETFVPAEDSEAGADFGDDDDEDDDEDLGPEHPVPVTAAGVAIVPFGRGLRLVTLQPAGDDDAWLERSIADGAVSSGRVEAQIADSRQRGFGADSLHSGDFTGARVRRDSEGWSLETLGRDGEFGTMSFESEAGARAALALFEATGVVQRPLDDDGQPIPESPEDFEEARRRFDETERQLAMSTDDDEPPPPADWSTRR